MVIAQPGEQIPQKPLRLWPGVVIVTVQWVLRFILPAIDSERMILGVIGGFCGGLAVVVWWVFFSRAPWSERLGAVALMIVAMFATSRIVDVSIAKGAQGMLLVMLAIPVLSLAFVAWAVASRHLSSGPRRAAMVATILLACGVWALVRTGGFTGSFENDLMWRWAKTPEEKLLAQEADKPAPVTPVPTVPAAVKIPEKQLVAKTVSVPVMSRTSPASAETVVKWRGFRGPGRDGIIPRVRIKTDWSASPPVEVWRRSIGPGWSSFAAGDNLIYTQEQRGPEEVVSSYKLTTGEPVWTHRDEARFWESNGGPGPRGTPSLSNGRLYTFGATGILNALNAADGSVVWSRKAAAETGQKLPAWGFASSPLVVDDVVIVAVSGKLVAYDLSTGDPRWFGPDGGVSYSSPQLATIGGVRQILLLNNAGVSSVALADGKLLWKHPWPGYPIVQPALTADGDILMSVSDQSGTRRISVAPVSAGWTVEERWTSLGLKPYFNDFVVHKGHAFGFDGGILACIDLTDGKRKWKGGRYGHGQMVLLPEQDLLLLLSEQGELALVAATPEKFTDIARVPAIEGKTWNHPVLAGNVLLVRNGQEMAAFRLSLADR